MTNPEQLQTERILDIKAKRQDIFNRSVKGLASQNFKQSVTVTGSCKYRGPDGLKCAIGHLVTDEQIAQAAQKATEYDNETYNTGVDYTQTNEGFSARQFIGIEFDPVVGSQFLEDLQSAHDMSDTYSPMKERLIDFAHDYSLELPPELKEENNGN